MKLLVFGKTGQVAQALRQCVIEAEFLGREQADLRDPDTCARAIERFEGDAVLNLAAYTDVDDAEKDEATAHLVNATAPGRMAEAAALRDLPFLTVSTDYVFDGSGQAAWKVSDKPAPLNAYGRTKLAGEQAVTAAQGDFVILRTSWVFSPHGDNFVKTMLRLSETRDELNIVSDQTGGPTFAGDIAASLVKIAQAMVDGRGTPGIYHYAGAPSTSWADFARAIFQKAERDVTVNDIPSAEFPTAAIRPQNSRLDCSALEAVFGITRPDWRAGLQRTLTELKGNP